MTKPPVLFVGLLALTALFTLATTHWPDDLVVLFAGGLISLVGGALTAEVVQNEAYHFLSMEGP